MVRIAFGPDRIRVAPPTADAWAALAAVFETHRYAIRTTDTDSYNCRQITGGTGRSLHSYGIALDINWTTNPYKDHAGKRKVQFSSKPTQDERALEVKENRADTDMTPELIRDVVAIRTTAGDPVFEWGGNWESVKDCMHFELDLSPDELARGIDWSSVNGTRRQEPLLPPGLNAFEVIARDGLRLRQGPGVEFPSLRTCPAGTLVYVISNTGSWALVDLEGDGRADGHMHAAYLTPVPPTT